VRDGHGPDAVAESVEGLDGSEVMEGTSFLVCDRFELVALVEDEVESGLGLAMGFVQELERCGFASACVGVDHYVAGASLVGGKYGVLFVGWAKDFY
jgi:hypothetical protein